MSANSLNSAKILAASKARRDGGLLWTALLRWAEVSKQRSALQHISDETLKDIGVSRDDALREAQRPFWDVPKR